ncbi:hypothetical protein N7474_009954 [Penicillium riverlandense]|uniref:uncharacterized protein n=1 Tax=Penicillium riverlandense TaxID=1903569 RepID=UPI00254985B5|nr:uncharacterized protein N7474_009954 [Penicillium riverlandense]KAJ5808685.1 hypothetical protein N7474_009954 [Penicillium riverlandense]
MSYRHSVPGPGSGEEMPEFYGGMPAEWAGVESSPFVGVPPNHHHQQQQPYCTGPVVPSSVLTPISLPDNSYRPSPVLSHHSQQQEYTSTEYQYGINEHIPPPQGLGISGPFPSDFPRTSAPHSSYVYSTPEDLKYNVVDTPSMSPQPPPSKRVKRTPSHTPSRETPIQILPHPEGLQRMEHERHNPPPEPQAPPPRPRAPGRGRRDPQAEDEDAFVEALREQNLAWKVIREMFQQRFHKDATEARLQMRLLRRRKERLARWDDSDIKLLICAHELWESKKYQFVADQMKELGANRAYTPEQCKAQLRLLEAKQYLRDLGSASPRPCQTRPFLPRDLANGPPAWQRSARTSMG